MMKEVREPSPFARGNIEVNLMRRRVIVGGGEIRHYYLS
jgi:hypothetical protein